MLFNRYDIPQEDKQHQGTNRVKHLLDNKDREWLNKAMNKTQTIKVTLERFDRYSTTIQCENRFITALRALFKGIVKLEWRVPATRKDKRLRLSGKRDW